MSDDSTVLVKDLKFPPLQNDLLLRAAWGQSVERVPVWIMRQAGRYLPEFKEMRAENDFFKVCCTPELACRVTLQPIERFALDAAIIFCDILVVPQALGMTVEMVPGKGPVLPQPLVMPDDLNKLHQQIDVSEKLGYVMDALTLTRHRLEGRVPLIGFCGAPWTLMMYMIEGGSSTTHSKAKRWLYCYPEASERLLRLLTQVCVDFLVAQARAGAQMLQVFESAAAALSPDLFSRFALPCLRRIASEVTAQLKSLPEQAAVPLCVFAFNGHYALEELCNSGYQIVSLDWSVRPTHARRLAVNAPHPITFQGNLDPPALYAPDDVLEALVREMLQRFGCQRYICNLGHGIYPDMDPEKVKVFVDAVHRISADMISKDE